MFSVLTRVEGEMRFFEGVPPSLSFPPSPLPAFLSALTYNGCPATDPPAGWGRKKYPSSSRLAADLSLATPHGVEAIFYGAASKVNLTDGLRFPEGAFFPFLPLWNAAASVQRRGEEGAEE